MTSMNKKTNHNSNNNNNDDNNNDNKDDNDTMHVNNLNNNLSSNNSNTVHRHIDDQPLRALPTSRAAGRRSKKHKQLVLLNYY